MKRLAQIIANRALQGLSLGVDTRCVATVMVVAQDLAGMRVHARHVERKLELDATAEFYRESANQSLRPVSV